MTTIRALSLSCLLLAVAVRAPSAPAPAGENLRVLDFWKSYSDAPNTLYKDILADALVPMRQRAARVAALRSRGDWEAYRREVQDKLLELVGPFPQKTPLNARTLGVVKKDGFRIEKVVYESQPGLLVTAAVFVPEPLQGRAPAIVYCSGHVPDSFRSAAYQYVILNLVKRGFIVLAFDPIGQGERLQFFNPQKGKSAFGASGLEHSHAGAPLFVVGSSLARLMIWDGIRGVDYLLTRDDVDAQRLGITGRSGGGTQAAYIAAVDERLLAAAPECYITTNEELLLSRGPQDPEQHFHRGFSSGFDQTDLLIARAPRPTLLLATSRDIFAIEGTRTAFGEARRAFAGLGAKAAMAMNVDDAEHESTRKNREATYAFFQHHLRLPGAAEDIAVERLGAEDLRITETGQVATAFPQSQTVHGLVQQEAAAREQELEARRRDLASHLAAVKSAAPRLAGYAPLPAGPQPAKFSGAYQRDGYTVEKHLLPVDDRHAIPLLALVPKDRAAARVVLYLHPEGKAAAAQPGGEMEALVRRGCVVVAPDVVGTGELGPTYLSTGNDKAHGPFKEWYGYVAMGRSIVGRQMRDVMRTVRFIEQRFGVAPAEIAGLARGAAGSLLLHAASLEGVCGRVALVEPLLSFRSLVNSRLYPVSYVTSAVPGALTAYDLPDLAAMLAPRRLLIAAPRAGSGEPAAAGEVERDTAVIARAYAARASDGGFTTLATSDGEAFARALAQWLE